MNNNLVIWTPDMPIKSPTMSLVRLRFRFTEVKTSSHNNLISEKDFSELYTEINSSLMMLEELIDDDFPDSGFTDDFSATH